MTFSIALNVPVFIQKQLAISLPETFSPRVLAPKMQLAELLQRDIHQDEKEREGKTDDRAKLLQKDLMAPNYYLQQSGFGDFQGTLFTWSQEKDRWVGC